MSILISGVVLLTHKKPEPSSKPVANSLAMQRRTRTGRKASTSKIDINDPRHVNDDDDDEDEQVIGEDGALWAVGEGSSDESEGEDEDIDHHQNPLHAHGTTSQVDNTKKDLTDSESEEEGVGLMQNRTSEDQQPDEFGEWAKVDTR